MRRRRVTAPAGTTLWVRVLLRRRLWISIRLNSPKLERRYDFFRPGSNGHRNTFRPSEISGMHTWRVDHTTFAYRTNLTDPSVGACSVTQTCPSN